MGLSKKEIAALVFETVGTELASNLFLELEKNEQLSLLKTLCAGRVHLSAEEVDLVYAEFVGLARAGSHARSEMQVNKRRSFAGIELPRASRVDDICQNIPEWILADYLKGQLDSVVSAVLGLIEPGKAGRLFKALPEERHSQVIVSLSSERLLESVVLDELESDLEELALKSVHGKYGHRVGGGQRVVDLVQALDPQMREHLLLELEGKDPSLAQHLELSMLSVERLAGLLPQHLSQVLSQLKDSDIGSFLKGESQHVQAAYLACLSSRRRADIECILAPATPVTRKQKFEASDKLRQCAQRMKEEGKVLFPWEESLVS